MDNRGDRVLLAYKKEIILLMKIVLIVQCRILSDMDTFQLLNGYLVKYLSIGRIAIGDIFSCFFFIDNFKDFQL